MIVSDVLIQTGHSGSVRRPHEQHQGTGVRIRGEDRPADVLPIRGDWPSSPSVGGRHIHWRRRVPGVPESFDHRRRDWMRRSSMSSENKILTCLMSVGLLYLFLFFYEAV